VVLTTLQSAAITTRELGLAVTTTLEALEAVEAITLAMALGVVGVVAAAATMVAVAVVILGVALIPGVALTLEVVVEAARGEHIPLLWLVLFVQCRLFVHVPAKLENYIVSREL
jgi:hypothetical protein